MDLTAMYLLICCQVLLEFCGKGSLESLLIATAANGGAVEDFGLLRLVSMLRDVGSAIGYIAGLGCLHRDLASRNVLVTDSDVAKLADFGLGRKSDGYIMSKARSLPVRWMAPESLLKGIWTVESDVWSFGIFCWEAASLGTIPFGNLASVDDLVAFIEAGGRPEVPLGCPAALYSFMESCWTTDASDRAPSAKLARCLDEVLTRLRPDGSCLEDGRRLQVE